MTEQKFKAGDLVTFKLGTTDIAYDFNRGYAVCFTKREIVRHEPAPFDWAGVKPGMGFTDGESTFLFIGFGYTYPLVFERQLNGYRDIVGYCFETVSRLTRAPEHDKKEMM